MKFINAFLTAALLSCAAADSPSKFIQYKNVGFSGSYKDVTGMDESSGSCQTTTKTFSGSLAPFDEDLAVHIRGPISLKKFAVYTGGGNSKRDIIKRHQHIKRNADVQTVATTKTVTVFETDGEEAPAATPAANPAVVAPVGQNKVIDKSYIANGWTSAESPAPAPTSSAPSSAPAPPSSAPGSWSRASYYDASSQTANNVVFTNNFGKDGTSGTWSMSFGNSLSYASSDGTTCAASNQVLKDATLPSNTEIILLSNQDCGSECGFIRKGVPNKKGWDGSYKIFVFNFKMPSASDSITTNHDMPAIWLLNGRIPRTSEYGTCSCWKSGCGEFDLWEVISAGSNQLTNHIHSSEGNSDAIAGGGGSGYYFDRPLNDYVTYAAIFDGSDVYLKELDNFNFDSSLDSSTVSGWISGSANVAASYSS